jgi:sulfide:quinone oxidoreductase
VTKQAPILVHNLQQAMSGKPADAKYNGYASCPLIIGKNQVILAEFGYGGKIMETFNPETEDAN